jgi:membrane-associated phospholipid phosphatase
MPTWLFALLLYAAPARLNVDTYSLQARFSVLVLLFLGTFALPSLFILYLYRVGFLRDLTMPLRADRRLPYLLTGVFYTFVTYFFAFRMSLFSETSPGVAVLLGGITLSVLLVGIINQYWKISAHAVGVGGVLGAIAVLLTKSGDTDLFLPLVGLIALCGLVGSARLQLNAHTLAQVVAGLGLGTLVSAVSAGWLL